MTISRSTSPRESIHVNSFGVVGDGRTVETRNLQAALDACHQQGGGMVSIPAGRYVTGSLFLHSNLTLHLDAGAVLLGSESLQDYPILPGRWEGAERDVHAPLLYGQHLRNVSVTGKGILDGRGEVWWKRFKEKSLAYPRPRLLSFSDCENVLIEGITLQNSPSWTVHPVRCTNVVIRGITILNPPDSPNTDGINPDSSCAVHISNCHISAGDDCIAIKSGSEHERPDRRAPARDITITNCTLARGHGGIVIGSEMHGGVQNVEVSHCEFTGTDRGIRIKSRRGRGGFIEDVRASHLVMTGVHSPVTVNLYYACGAWGDQRISDRRPRPPDEGTPRIRRIHLSHITARDVKQTAGFIYGLPELPLEEITLQDISVSMAADSEPGFPEMADGLQKMRQAGLVLQNANRVVLENVEIAGQSGPAFQVMDSSDVRFLACGTPNPDPAAPVVSLRNVQDALLQDCQTGSTTGLFLHVEGARSQHVDLVGGSRIQAGQLIECANDVPPKVVRVNPQAVT